MERINAQVVIFPNSVNSQTVTANWKAINVCTMFTKWGRRKPGNYRSVSLTSVIKKDVSLYYRSGNRLFIKIIRLGRINMICEIKV